MTPVPVPVPVPLERAIRGGERPRTEGREKKKGGGDGLVIMMMIVVVGGGGVLGGEWGRFLFKLTAAFIFIGFCFCPHVLKVFAHITHAWSEESSGTRVE